MNEIGKWYLTAPPWTGGAIEMVPGQLVPLPAEATGSMNGTKSAPLPKSTVNVMHENFPTGLLLRVMRFVVLRCCGPAQQFPNIGLVCVRLATSPVECGDLASFVDDSYGR